MIRGQRSIWPKSGGTATGIFSTKGKQKMDSTSSFAHQGVKAYAKGSSTRSEPKSTTSSNLRHLPPGSKVPGGSK